MPPPPAADSIYMDQTYKDGLGARRDHLCPGCHGRAWNSQPFHPIGNKTDTYSKPHEEGSINFSFVKVSLPLHICYCFRFLRKSVKIHRLPNI